MQLKIDLNADVGESFGRYRLGLDGELIPLISSANIACGFHAGDPGVMRATVQLAADNHVALGAHPGLPDLVGFGRRAMDISLDEIRDLVTYQVGALQAFAVACGTRLQHVKPHGALYNMAVADPRIWGAVMEAMTRLDPSLILMTLAGRNRSELATMSRRSGIRVAGEFFGDRAYHADGSLVSRKLPGSVIEDHERVADRVVRMVTENRVTCIDGSEISMHAHTICVHGDNPSALALVKAMRGRLEQSGIAITPLGSLLADPSIAVTGGASDR